MSYKKVAYLNLITSNNRGETESGERFNLAWSQVESLRSVMDKNGRFCTKIRTKSGDEFEVFQEFESVMREWEQHLREASLHG